MKSLYARFVLWLISPGLAVWDERKVASEKRIAREERDARDSVFKELDRRAAERVTVRLKSTKTWE